MILLAILEPVFIRLTGQATILDQLNEKEGV